MDNFYRFIWSRFCAPRIESYGERYLSELHSEDYPISYNIFLFLGYVNYISDLYFTVGSTHMIIGKIYLDKAIEGELPFDIIGKFHQINCNCLEKQNELEIKAEEEIMKKE